MEKKNTMPKIALLFGGCTYNINVVVFSVAIGAIATNFNATSTQLSQIINLPALFMIPAILISAKLAEKMSKKDILIGAWILFMASGIFASMATSIQMLLISRAITGFSMGLIISIPKAMIAQLYPQEIGQLNGLQTSCTLAISFICSLTAGGLAAISWQYPIYLFFMGIIFLVLIVIYVPKVPAEKKEYTEVKQVNRSYGAKIWFTVLCGTFMFMIFCPIQAKLTLLILQNGFGDSLVAGYARAFLTIGSVTGGFIFAALAKKNKKMVLIIALILATAGYYFVSCTSNIFILFIAIFVAGMSSLGMILPWFGSTIAQSVDKSRVTMLLSIFMMCNYLSQFLATYVVAGMEKIANNSNPTVALFGVFICLFVSLFVAIVVLYIVPKKEVSQV